MIRNLRRDFLCRILSALSPRTRNRRCARRPFVESLEDRCLLTAYVIDTIADDPLAGAADTDGLVSLREAIEAANTNAAFGDAAAGDGGGAVDAMTFDTSLSGQMIVLGGTGLTISDDLSLTGLGAENLTISGNDHSFDLLVIESDVAAAFSGLTIADSASGIYVIEGSLRIHDSVITNNNYSGIYNDSGSVLVSSSSITGNSSEFEGGGGIYNYGGSVIVTSSTIAGNSSEFDGGGIYNDGGSVTIEAGSVLDDNSAVDGGGIWNGGALEINDSTLSHNSAGSGGAIANREGGLVVVNNGTFATNAASSGGAISNLGEPASGNPSTLDITDSMFVGNTANYGGVITNAGPVTITRCTFLENSAQVDGGAIHNSHNPFIPDEDSRLVVVDSLFAANTSLGTGAFDGGGAIVNFNNSTLEIVNSTLSGNRANSNGAGVYNSGTLTITNATITGNRADADGDGSGNGGGVFNYPHLSVQPARSLQNSLVAGNLRGTAGSDSPDDISGDLTNLSGAHNLIGDAATSGGLTDGVGGNIVGNAGAGTIDITTVLDTNLADNGGPTRTHALVAGGLAVDAGDSALAVDAEGDPLSFDQRGSGFARIVGGTVDIGAFEAPPLTLSVGIDIKPGSDNNPINLASQGVIAVAILSTSDFDASLVDASTVQFAGAYAVHSALEDVDGDGDLDMILHFRVQETNLADVYAALLAEDPDANHQSALVSLEGETINDDLFAGEDFADLFLAGKSLRKLLEALALQGLL